MNENRNIIYFDEYGTLIIDLINSHITHNGKVTTVNYPLGIEHKYLNFTYDSVEDWIKFRKKCEHVGIDTLDKIKMVYPEVLI